MTKAEFDYDDIVLVDERSDAQFRPGRKAWVVGVFADRTDVKFDWLPPGTVYTVEFEDGTAVDIPENCLRRWQG